MTCSNRDATSSITYRMVLIIYWPNGSPMSC